MVFKKLDFLSSPFQFNIGGQQHIKKTQFGGILSFGAVTSALIYFIYSFYLYLTNQIQPKFLLQTYVSGEETDIELHNNLLAFRYEYDTNQSIEKIEKQNNRTYMLYYPSIQVMDSNHTNNIYLKYHKCDNTELLGFYCIDFSSVNNYTLRLNDKQNQYIRLAIVVTSCYSNSINNGNCASKNETDNLSGGLLHLKLLTQQFNTTSKKIQTNYKNFLINCFLNKRVDSSYEIIKQKTSVLSGAFFQSQEIFSSPISYQLSASSIENYSRFQIQANIQPSEQIQYIKIQYYSFPEILASCNSVLALVMTVGIIAKFLSMKLIKQDLFLFTLQNMYQNTYQNIIDRRNQTLEAQGDIQKKQNETKIKEEKDKQKKEMQNFNKIFSKQKLKKKTQGSFNNQDSMSWQNKKNYQLDQQVQFIKLPPNINFSFPQQQQQQQYLDDKIDQNNNGKKKTVDSPEIKQQEEILSSLNNNSQQETLQQQSNQNLKNYKQQIGEYEDHQTQNQNILRTSIQKEQQSQLIEDQISQQNQESICIEYKQKSEQIPSFQTFLISDINHTKAQQNRLKSITSFTNQFPISYQIHQNQQKTNNQLTDYLTHPLSLGFTKISSPQSIADQCNMESEIQLFQKQQSFNLLSIQEKESQSNQFDVSQQRESKNNFGNGQIDFQVINTQKYPINKDQNLIINSSNQGIKNSDILATNILLQDLKEMQKKDEKSHPAQIQIDRSRNKTAKEDNKKSKNEQLDQQQKNCETEIEKKIKIQKNLSDGQQFKQLDEQEIIEEQNQKLDDNQNPQRQRLYNLFSDTIKKSVKNAIFKMKIWKRREYLKDQGLDQETVEQIDQYLNESVDIHCVQHDLLLIKKAIMILLSHEQLAALKLVGISKQGIKDKTNHFMNQLSLLKSQDQQLKMINSFLTRQQNQCDITEIDQRIFQSISIL